MKRQKIGFLAFLCAISLLPTIAFGLAGLSEQTFEYQYSPKVLIEFSVPSDWCPPQYSDHQRCIRLYPVPEHEYWVSDGYKNLDLLSAVNLPQVTEPTYIMGKSYTNGRWLIFDLTKDKEVFSNASYEIVEQQWEKLGNSTPSFVDTDNYSTYFHQLTKASQNMQNEADKGAISMVLWLWGFVAVIAIVLGGALAAIIYLLSYFFSKKPRHGYSKYLLWSSGVTIVIFLVLIGYFYVGLHSLSKGLCGNELVEDVKQGSSVHAVIFVRDCGATSGFSTQVSILPATEGLDNDMTGNVFIADQGSQFNSAGGPLVKVIWKDVTHMEIQYNASARTFLQAAKSGDTEIKYTSI